MTTSLRGRAAIAAVAVLAVAAAGCGASKTTTTTHAATSGGAAAGYSRTSATTTSTTAAAPAAAKRYVLRATLTPGADVPKPKDATGARGTFTATITLHGKTGTLSWVLSFAHLSGPATAAHVHVGPPGQAGPVAIPLCGPCRSPDKGSFSGPIGGNAQLLAALLHGGAYVNVHTKLNPAGEIRGQIRAKRA